MIEAFNIDAGNNKIKIEYGTIKHIRAGTIYRHIVKHSIVITAKVCVLVHLIKCNNNQR